MPILPENKKRYPKDWKEISRRIRFERAGNCCENCGVENYSVGYREKDLFYPMATPPYGQPEGMSDYKAALEIKQHFNEWQEPKCIVIVLTTAHLDHTPENNDERNLKALCQKCHNLYDAAHRKGSRRSGRMKNQLSIQFIQHEL